MGNTFLEGLSDKQKEVVLHQEGPLFVVSGPGSGKTRVLTHRVARLVGEGESAKSILIVTFTNRAAEEFNTRLTKLLGTKSKGLRTGTLHSIASRILRLHGKADGLKPNFVIFDTRDCLRILRVIAKELRIPRDLCPIDLALESITRYKEKLMTPNMVREFLKTKAIVSFYEQCVAELYNQYQNALAECGALDFGDLIMRCVFLLKKYPEVAEKLGIKWLLVDEAQDTDPSQFEMVNLLLGDGRNLMLVADPDQSIYRFRGAEPRLVLGFEEIYPDGKTIALGQNYRSTQSIVRAASTLISKNTQRHAHDLWTENEEGVPVVVSTCADPFSEAEDVFRRIAELRSLHGLKWMDFAVLYRTNFQSLALEEAALHFNIPYNVVGSRFFDRPEVMDLVLYLKLLSDPQDTSTINTIVGRPVCGISKQTWDRIIALNSERQESMWISIQRYAKSTTDGFEKKLVTDFFNNVVRLQKEVNKLTTPALLAEILLTTNLERYYADRETQSSKSTGTSPLENIAQFLSIISKRFPGLAVNEIPRLIEYVGRMTAQVGDSSDCVQLMTLHAAKGTEFPVVSLVGVEEGLLPHWRATQDDHLDEALEEERRLLYVGMTRAMQRLFLSSCKERINPTRGRVSCVPSRFFQDLALIVKE